MPTIRELNAAPPKRMIVRIAVAVGFVLAIYLYVAHIEARDRDRLETANHVLQMVSHGRAREALRQAVDAQRSFGDEPILSRATWAALMAGGGRHGSKALLRRTIRYTPVSPDFRLEFSKDGRFLAAIDGATISVWNAQSGELVVSTTAGDRFVGFLRSGSRYFGLLASHQFYDLVSDVIALPDGYRYAQPSKDALSEMAPGGDWAFRVPAYETGRADYPIKLINLHTGEKREVDVNYTCCGPVAVNSGATRIAASRASWDVFWSEMWDARKRAPIGRDAPGDNSQIYFSDALNAMVSVPLHPANDNFWFTDTDSGKLLFSVPLREFLQIAGSNKGAACGGVARTLPDNSIQDSAQLAIADDPEGMWFAVCSNNTIQLYRGVNSPYLNEIAAREVSPAPATSH
jgi:hypothetical protein